MSDSLRLEDIEALMGSGGDAAGEPEGVAPYNFKRPKRVPQEHIRSLQGLHETFVRKIEFSFGALLRQIADATLVSVLQLTYQEFLDSLPSPTCFNLVALKGSKSGIVVELGLEFVLAMIDRLMGGKGEPVGTVRELTELERTTVLRQVLSAILADYQDAWEPVGAIELTPSGYESNPAQAQFVGSNELVVLVVIGLKFGEVEGTLHICLPFVSLKPLLTTIGQGNRILDEEEHATKDAAARMRRHALAVPMRVGVEIRGTRAPLRTILNMREGDVVRLDAPVEKDIALIVNGVQKFLARPVSRGGRKAVQVTHPLGEAGR